MNIDLTSGVKPASNVLLAIKDLTASYDGKVAVDGVCLEVEFGDYLAIVGSNGSGKSTLIKCLTGIKKADSGEIELCGVKRQEISYLPQVSGISKDFPASVLEVATSGCVSSRRFGLKNKHDRHCALTNLSRLGLDDLAHCAFSELSGGQQQRVLLARALCSAAKLLVLDEPSNGLDPDISRKLYDTLSELNKEGLTIIMITHDRRTLPECNKILVLDKQVKFFGDAKDYAF